MNAAPSSRLNQTERYTIYGSVFGLTFPLIAAFIDILLRHLPLTWTGAYQSQLENPLLWIIDMAPVVLGAFAGLAGSRQDNLEALNKQLHSREIELQTAQQTLEQRVDQRTTELAISNAEGAKREQELQAIAEIARSLATERDLDKLLALVTRIVSERFGFYHVGIFLVDPTGKYAVLRAANSIGGQQMLDRQHRLEVGHTGLVGNVTATGQARIALDAGADAFFFNNPDLPDTRSEMTLPLTARGKIIGALDVQSTTPNAFRDKDAAIIGLLADQIAIAIDNTQLLEETQSALAESRAVFNEYLGQAWQRKAGSAILGYHETVSGGTVLTQDSTLPESDGNGRSFFEVPIRVRGQTIGSLEIRPVAVQRAWTADELNVIDAVAERLGLALDNARLFEETSTRASRERLVTEITTKIRGTNNPQEMIKTAVDELQRALGATRVEVVPQRAAPPPDK